ncbi:MAG: NTP transferase domain-containing protein [candidate division Zixibacteria bacterium]|nr:NTP transferase domain-containing protein [candidate division Zixibacteria bacterium]
MRVIIPAAGLGSRLRPHTHTIPKSLLHVAGKPILGHILDRVAQLEPEEIIVITGFLGEMVQEYVTEHYSIKTRFVQQKELLGLGYAVDMALGDMPDSPVLIILGDTIVEADMKKFISDGDNVLGVMPVVDPQRFGIADVKNGKVSGLVEKPTEPKSNLALIGLYFIKNSQMLKKHLDKIISTDKRTKGEYQLTDALQGMIEDKTVFNAYSVGGWFDCGKRETLIETNRHLLKKNKATPSIEGSVIIPPSFVAPTAKIESSIIGPYVSVSDGATVKNSIIRNSIVGFEAEVKNSLLSDSLIGHRATVIGDYGTLNVGDSSEVGHF